MSPHHQNSSIHRACDRCRRKKARCDSIDYSCTVCRAAGQDCSFDIAPGKRGPKGKPRRRSTANVRDHDPLERSVSSLVYTAEPTCHPTTLDRYRALADAVAHASSFSTSLEGVVRECADLFFAYIVPFNMSVQEPIFRHLVNQALVTSPPGLSLSQSNFALITAVCAKTCLFMPSDLFPLGDCLGNIFLQASRGCLASYLDADLENPCADSITIRYLHSNCLHISARPKIAWHVFGEAVRLIMHMRLYDEDSYASLPLIEADLRRNAFWQLYIGDKSLAVLRSMPIAIHDFAFERGITALYPSGDQTEAALGFNAGTKLWRYAADLLLQIRLITTSQAPGSGLHPSLMPSDYTTLGDLYVRFATCLDDLPPHLLPNYSNLLSNNNEISTRTLFPVQIVDLHVTYHCLKMHLTMALEKIGYFSYAGHPSDMIVLLRKTEIAGDMVRLLQRLPFWSLKVNGEPCTEKIRVVGASLLAIIQEEPSSSPLGTRARRDFAVLLDILSQLDSKASDSLRQEFL